MHAYRILNIDIRGSTQLGKYFATEVQRGLYVKFIQEYQERAREAILARDGVFDKTMGDGVQALFNVYQQGILPTIVPSSSDPLNDAVDCAFKIFEAFRDLVAKHATTWQHIAPPEDLCLGAGLTMGSGFIGSFSSADLQGLEYTVLGDVANDAGKLVNLARAEDIQDYLREWLAPSPDKRTFRPVRRIDQNGRDEQVSEDAISKLINVFQTGQSVLLADLGCARISTNVDYECYKLKIDPKKQILNLVIIKNDPSTP